MKKVLILIAMIALPVFASGQHVSNDAKKQKDTISVENALPAQKVDAKMVSHVSASAQDLSYKKSNDLISIKAYRKSLQIKVKEIKNC